MTPDRDLPDDEVTRLLAQVMHDEVDGLPVSNDSLSRIQARAAEGTGRAAWRWITPLAAAAVVALVATGVVLLPHGGSRTSAPPASSSLPTRPTTAPPQPTPSSTPTRSTSPEPTPTNSGPTHSSTPSDGALSSACIGAGDRGYAYYVSDLNGLGPRLYRAIVRTSCHLGIEEALTVPAGKDADYTSPWPAGTKVIAMGVSGYLATVNLSAFPQTTPEEELAAVQQLVFTVTANQPSISRVRLLVNGQAPRGTLDWTAPVHRAPLLDTLSLVWILTPGNGATVTSPISVRIYGTGYEGMIPLQIVNVADPNTIVASGSVVTQMGAFDEATTTFDLPPGTYELRAFNDSGADDTLTLWDTRVFTVG